MPKLYDNLQMNMGLVLDLDFVEATGTIVRDKSKNHHIGAFGGGAAAPTWTQLPSGVWVPSFDGADDQILPSPEATVVGAPYPECTVIVWFNATSITDTHALFAIGNIHMAIEFKTGSLLRGRLLNVATNYYAVGDDVISTGIWNQAALTWGAAGMKLYVNAVLDGTNTFTGTHTGAGEIPAIGNVRYQAAKAHHGLIGEVWVYSRQLPVSELRWINLATRGRYGL